MKFSTPTPQIKRQEQADPAPLSPVDTTMISSTPTPQKWRQKETSPITPDLHHDTALVDLTIDSGNDELDEQEAFEQAQALSNQRKLARTHPRLRDIHDADKFRPCKTSSLPQEATYYAWLTDMENAKTRYIATHLHGVRPNPQSSPDKYMCERAHAEMISGKYGMTALKPCDRCVEAGVTCRVYHPDCYEWYIAGRCSLAHLGWRCQRCRSTLKLRKGGCNAQFEE
jgi:hypothetical protein